MRYRQRRHDERCERDITLSDGSGAQCQRYKAGDSPYCTQHTNQGNTTMAYKLIDCVTGTATYFPRLEPARKAAEHARLTDYEIHNAGECIVWKLPGNATPMEAERI